ncbi:MAG: ABC transporter permease, partial [Bryobacteraceae bacterium]
ASVFSSVFVWLGGGIANIEANGVTYAGKADEVSGDYFSALGVHPVLGRVLTPEDVPLAGRPSARVAVISYECWQNRYDGDPHVLGKTIRVENIPFTIIGVSPRRFTGMAVDSSPEATMPIDSTEPELTNRSALRWFAYARLKPGVSIAQARAQMQALWPGVLQATAPDHFQAGQRARFFALRPDIQPAAQGYSYMREKLKEPLELLMALVGAVLLIACVNLANLLLARSSSRRHEFSVRVAMGAGRWPLMRMLLTEALLLSCAGAALGVLMASWTARRLLQTFWTGFVPLSIDPSPDTRVLAFTAALAIFTGLLFGIVPAWQMSRSDPAKALSQSARTTGGRTGGFSRALITAQISASLVLLIGATLFVRSLQNLQNVDLGYRRDHLLIMQPISQPGRKKIENRAQYFHELATRLSQLPGVESANYLDVGLATGFELKAPVSTGTGNDVVRAVEDVAGPGLFQMIGVRVLAGREFTWRDNKQAPRVAIISQNLAKALFPHRNPVGRTIDLGTKKENRGLRIVGVVNNADLWNFSNHKPFAVYQPLLQEPHTNWPKCIIRTRINPVSVEHSAERTLASFGHQYSLRTQTFRQRAGETLVNQRMIAQLASGFSLLALLLAAIGLYGVMSYAVTRRTAEIGIRMALGAVRGDILRMIFREVLVLVAIGIAAAVPVSIACGKLISGMLFEVSATDPVTIAIASSILIAVAAIAGFLPARRAARVDPMVALRYE